MYASGIDLQNLDGMCCDGCEGLSGVGLVSDTPTSPSWLDSLGTQIDRILGRVSGSGATYPIQTPPYTPSYPTNTATYAQGEPYSMFSPSANWLPWAIAAGVLIFASRRGRR